MRVPWFSALVVCALAAATDARAGCYVPGDYENISQALGVDCADIVVNGAEYEWTSEPTTYLGLYESVTIRGDGTRPRLPTLIVKGYLAEIHLEFVELGASDGTYDPYSPAFQQNSGHLTMKDVVLGYTSRVGISAVKTNVELIDVQASGFGGERVPVWITGDGNGDFVADGVYTARIVGGEFAGNTVPSIVLGAVDASIEGTAFNANSADTGADVVAWGDGRQALDVLGATFHGSAALGTYEEGVGGSIVASNIDLYVKDATFEGCYAKAWGGAIGFWTDETDVPGPLTIEGSSFTNCGSSGSGGAIFAFNADVSVSGSTFANTWSNEAAGAIGLSRGSFFVQDSSFKSATTLGAGGALAAYDASGTVTRTEFIGPTSAVAAKYGGGAVIAAGSAVFDDVSFTSLTVDNDNLDEGAYGGAIYAESADVEVHGQGKETFVDVWAQAGGAIAAVSSTVLVDDVIARDLGGWYGGGFFGYDADLTLGGSRFETLEGSDGGALLTSVGTRRLHVAGNRICGMVASGGDSVVQFDSPVGATVDLHNNAFVGGRATDGTVVLLESLYPGGVTSIVNNTFAWNFPLRADLVLYENDADVRNNLFLGAPGGVAVDAAVRGATGGYNLYFGNVKATDDPNGVFPSEGDVRGDPMLFAASGDGCDADLHLQWGSPARDAGDPDPAYQDGDGSRADIGAFGGPDGGIVDLDGDGAPSEVDCDDLDDAVRPGSDEVPYDGVDQDCIGGDACDEDGDGFLAAIGACGGDDCDDADGGVFPGAVEAVGDDVDQNCDGADAKTWVGGGGGCGCSSGSAPSASWFALLALAAVPWRRRSGVGCERRAFGG